jgi:organic hydroperoxide reductase OsmC/OhrA
MVWSTLSVRATLSACHMCVLSILKQQKFRDNHEVTIEATTLRDPTPHTPAEPAAATFRVSIPMIDATGSSKSW